MSASYFTVYVVNGDMGKDRFSGTKKGTYRIEVRITAKGNKGYKAGSKTVTCKVTVR